MTKIKINKTLRNFLIAILVIILFFVCTKLVPEKKLSEKYQGFDLSTSQGAVSAGKTYAEYQDEHKNAKTPNLQVAVDVFAYDADKSTGISTVSNYEGKDAVLADERSFVVWNFEEMCDALTKDTNNDGIIDQYALSGFNSEFAGPAIYSNGGQITGRDSNGNLYLDTGDKTMEAWNWVKDIFTKYNKPAEEGANWDYFKSDFLNGFTAFYNDQEYDAQPNGMLADMKDDWGMVCFPLGPNSDGKYFTMNQDNMLVIPAYYPQDKVNKILKIYDFWSDDVPGYEDEDAWKEFYYGSFRDTRAVDETMQYMMDNSKSWDAWLVPNFNWAPISWSVCAGADPQETIESMRNELQAALDDINQ